MVSRFPFFRASPLVVVAVASPVDETIAVAFVAKKVVDGVRAVSAALKGGKAATSVADSAADGVKLQKQLASESQLGQLADGGGTVISQPAK